MGARVVVVVEYCTLDRFPLYLWGGGGGKWNLHRYRGMPVYFPLTKKLESLS